ncbi:MAG: hypothetical protein AAB322_07095, partial [Pseudomonadota bacterium]
PPPPGGGGWGGGGARGSGGGGVGGGPPEKCALSRPHGAFVDPSGAITISDSENGRVLRIGR